jgi:hypothetical protein
MKKNPDYVNRPERNENFRAGRFFNYGLFKKTDKNVHLSKSNDTATNADWNTKGIGNNTNRNI